MILLLLTVLWRLGEEEVVNVIVLLQGALLSPDDPGGALPQMVAHHGLLVILGVKVLVVAAVHTVAAQHLALL